MLPAAWMAVVVSPACAGTPAPPRTIELRGGGAQPDGRKNPAWDWRVRLSRGVKPRREARFTRRAIYKQYAGDAGILDECRRWTQTLPKTPCTQTTGATP
jgi:hypothetical protein